MSKKVEKDCLSLRDQKILQLRHNGHTYKEIGVALDVCTARAHELTVRAKKRLADLTEAVFEGEVKDE